jgi:hypothetical protein
VTDGPQYGTGPAAARPPAPGGAAAYQGGSPAPGAARPAADSFVATPAGPAAGPATGAGPAGPAAAQPLRAAAKSRRARLVVRRVDPWSVLKFSLLFSLCLLIVFVVAVAALYFALQALGVFDSVNQFVRDLTQANAGGTSTGGFDVTFSATRVIGGAAVIGLINVVIITAISTLGAFLYNLCSDIVGGIEVTLAERE